jgi:hypothetical protein
LNKLNQARQEFFEKNFSSEELIKGSLILSFRGVGNIGRIFELINHHHLVYITTENNEEAKRALDKTRNLARELCDGLGGKLTTQEIKCLLSCISEKGRELGECERLFLGTLIKGELRK